MRKKRRLFLFIILITILLSNISLAEVDIPESSSSFYVYDDADILDGEIENYIVKTNEILYKKTGAQVVVVSTNELNGMDINRYANLLFENWNIGSKEYDNGVLILIVPNERELWIEVGYGLEGALPDGKIGRIRDEDIFPYFKEGEYSKGVLNGFNSILNLIENEYDIRLNREEINKDLYDFSQERGSGSRLFNSVGRVIIVILIILFLFIDFRFFNGLLTYSILRSFRFGGSSFNNDHDNRGGGGSSGGGGAGGRW